MSGLKSRYVCLFGALMWTMLMMWTLAALKVFMVWENVNTRNKPFIAGVRVCASD